MFGSCLLGADSGAVEPFRLYCVLILKKFIHSVCHSHLLFIFRGHLFYQLGFSFSWLLCLGCNICNMETYMPTALKVNIIRCQFLPDLEKKGQETFLLKS